MYKVKCYEKKIAGLDNVLKNLIEHKQNVKEKAEIGRIEELKEVTDADLENAINVQDSLIHKLDSCKADIFIHKKNLEKVKAKQKRCSIINKDMTIEIDRLHSANYKMDLELKRLEERRQNRNINTENSVDTVFAQNIEEEMS